MSETLPAPPVTDRSETPPASRRSRGRLAALGLLGALVVALPLGQVLRFQTAELRALTAREARLDPVAHTVDVQRSLVLHRGLAAAVLRGNPDLETDRLMQQGEVDGRLAALAVALAAGPWEHAVREGDALRVDWSLLVRQLLARSLGAADSDEAHRLLIEQTLQVIDLLDDAPAAQTGGGAARAWSAALALPRLAQATAALAAAPAPSLPRELAVAQALAARAHAALNTALDRSNRDALPPSAALAAARAAAAAATDRCYAAWRREGGSETARTATGAALQAQYALFGELRAAVAGALAGRRAALERRRLALRAALTLLGLAAALSTLLLQIRRGACDDAAAGGSEHGTDEAPPRNADRVAAGLLLARLRDADDPRRSKVAPARESAAPRPTAQPPAEG